MPIDAASQICALVLSFFASSGLQSSFLDRLVSRVPLVHALIYIVGGVDGRHGRQTRGDEFAYLSSSWPLLVFVRVA